jgi:REP element-mobilizing transposase RayT
MWKPLRQNRLPRHQRSSIRLKEYDYASAGAYFVTVNTFGRECCFGEIEDGAIQLSEIGVIADVCWCAIPDEVPNVSLDVYQIMPDHLHGIVVLWDECVSRDLINQIPTEQTHHPGLQNAPDIPVGLSLARSPAEQNWPLMKNPKRTLGKVLRHFKAKSAKLIHDSGYQDFKWQSRYHDRIVRSRQELNAIRTYILQNPASWAAKNLREMGGA